MSVHTTTVTSMTKLLTTRMIAALLLAALVAATTTATAHAEAFGVGAFDGQVAADAEGAPYTQAGGHPYSASTSIRWTTVPDPTYPGTVRAVEPTKDAFVDLPPGLVGNVTMASMCTTDQLAAPNSSPTCPVDSQVGSVTLYFNDPANGSPPGPLYRMVPSQGSPARFGFNVSGTLVLLSARLRNDGEYALALDSREISEGIGILGVDVTLWGTPADPSHDPERRCPGAGVSGCTTQAPRVPFLTLPTACTPAGQGLVTSLRTDSWRNPGVFATASFESHLPPAFPAAPGDWGPAQGPTDCDRVPFDPTAVLAPTEQAAEVPTGLDVDLRFPQDALLDAGRIATAHLRRATVTFPEGMTINPGAAGGLEACGDEQLGLGTTRPLTCPEASTVGSATAVTPLIEESLSGGVYLRTQASDDPASGQMFRVALVLRNAARGIDVRLAGAVTADPATGRLVATFDDNPQLPVSDIHLRLKSGSRAPLVVPTSCGSNAIDTRLTSWAGHDIARPDTFDVACGPAVGGFSPSVTAGVPDAHAGAFTPFALSMVKPDGNAAVRGLRLELPTGLLARLKGNVGSQVGSVTAFAGPGATPFALPGKVFLEGSYDDAPFSLRVVVPAKAGPFDLGDVTVRQKIYVDPVDAHVTVVSDPLPTIVKGVPVRLQRLDVSVDKPGFVINPTSCAPKQIGGALSALDGQSVPINVRFQVGDCASLGLKPALGLTLSGKGQTKDGGHPAVSATLTQPAGGANLKKVRVALPLSLALDPDNAASDGLCSFVEGSKPNPVCPASSVVGRATAVSPILNEPLTGPVYFVKNERKDPKSGRSIKTTPKLVIPLTGENGVKLTLTGVSSVPDNQHLVTTFDAIPDAPVSSFKLDITGGKKGILVVSDADICKATQIADQQVDGQNNKSADADVFIQTPSCPTKIITKKVTAKAVTLKVGGLGAGKVTITGKGIHKTSKTVTKSTVATIAAKRTKAKLGKITVSFDPAGPAKARRTTTR